MAAAAPIRLVDYTPWPFALPDIHLNVDVRSDHVLVTSRLLLEPQQAGAAILRTLAPPGHA